MRCVRRAALFSARGGSRHRCVPSLHQTFVLLAPTLQSRCLGLHQTRQRRAWRRHTLAGTVGKQPEHLGLRGRLVLHSEALEPAGFLRKSDDVDCVGGRHPWDEAQNIGRDGPKLLLPGGLSDRAKYPRLVVQTAPSRAERACMLPCGDRVRPRTGRGSGTTAEPNHAARQSARSHERAPLKCAAPASPASAQGHR